MSLQKNDCCVLTLENYTAEGYGVGRTAEGLTVFVPGGARGDRAEVQLLKVRRTYAFGRILRLLEPAPCRIAPDCPVFARCGGCDFRHITYEEELWLKARRVEDALQRIGGFVMELPEIVPSPLPDGYRTAKETMMQASACADGGEIFLNGVQSLLHPGVSVIQKFLHHSVFPP